MNTNIRRLGSLVSSILAAGSLLIAMPALADQPTSPLSPSDSGTSRNWAGYVAKGSGFTAVSGSWTVPQPQTASHMSADATWIGIGGVNTSDLIQAGTQALANRNGSFTYQAWYELLPGSSRPISMTVSPGDSMSASITQQNDGQWLISIRNNTSGQTYQNTVSYNSSLSSAEWIEEMPSSGHTFIPLDDFGTVEFTGGQAVQNGQTLDLAQAGAQTMTLTNSSRQAMATVSSLNSDGTSFSVSRTSAAPDTMVRFASGRNRVSRTGTGVNGYFPSQTTVPQIPGSQISIRGSELGSIFRLKRSR